MAQPKTGTIVGTVHALQPDGVIMRVKGDNLLKLYYGTDITEIHKEDLRKSIGAPRSLYAARDGETTGVPGMSLKAFYPVHPIAA